MTKVQIAAC